MSDELNERPLTPFPEDNIVIEGAKIVEEVKTIKEDVVAEAKDVAEEAKDVVEDVVAEAKDVAEEAKDVVEGVVEDVVEDIKNIAESKIADEVKSIGNKVKNIVDEVKNIGDEVKNMGEMKLTIIQEEEEVGSVKTNDVNKSQLFINSYIALKEKIKGEEITTASIVHILKLSMELVEDLKDIKGEEQRDFAVSLVREIINKSKLTASQKENCLLVIDFGVLDHVVDFVVDATTGKVNINKVKKKVSKLFSCCK